LKMAPGAYPFSVPYSGRLWQMLDSPDKIYPGQNTLTYSSLQSVKRENLYNIDSSKI
jgi:hypothetical protein